MQHVTHFINKAKPGTPLSNKEYEAFFKPQKPKLRAIAVCKKRMAYGCDEPRIHRIDLWENHGAVPTGTVCTELIYYSHFDSFCEFAKFRCLNKLYYVKVRTWASSQQSVNRSPHSGDHISFGPSKSDESPTTISQPTTSFPEHSTMELGFKSLVSEDPRRKMETPNHHDYETNQIVQASTVKPRPADTKVAEFILKVCDSWGRQHMDMFPFSAFCSLKVEQCKGSKDLLRVPCTNRNYKTYLSPSIPLDSWTPGYEITTTDTEFFAGLPEYSGHSSVFWCARLALSGCQDLAVSRWLSAEYAAYQMGDFPDQICDSEDSMYPTYCAFKSRQCLMKKYNQKLYRTGCFQEQKYTKFSEEEAEELVQSWINKYDFS
eukprot:XP_017951110.1 PREDICTED: acrosin-binding protein-like [Xenopus tropicalis]